MSNSKRKPAARSRGAQRRRAGLVPLSAIVSVTLLSLVAPAMAAPPPAPNAHPNAHPKAETPQEQPDKPSARRERVGATARRAAAASRTQPAPPGDRVAMRTRTAPAPDDATPASTDPEGDAKPPKKARRRRESGSGPDAPADDAADRKISLDEDFLVEGKLEKPNAFYILRRSQSAYDWARLDAKFLPLVLESVQDPLF